ncbi:MAG: outer membrane protein assembly factor BamC [Gammaproteobacteria bacterium]|nr:outer membrane protein assembly factor BamC [Gammaproteobacteria bacterium]
MKRFSALSVLAMMLLTQLACSSGGSNQINYRGSQVTPTLELPPDLIARSTDENLALPGSDVGTAARSGRFVETGALDLELRTLPEIEGIRIQGQGDWYWLEVNSPPHEVYQQLRTFWAEQGFRLAVDEPAIGIMETEWLSMKPNNESFFASILATLRSSEYKDMYKTRLQRGPQPEMSLVSVAHRGLEYMVDEDDGPQWQGELTKGWRLTPADPGKEYEILSRFMLFLGMQEPQIKLELEKIGLFASRARLAFYDDEDDNSDSYLLVKQGFSQTWNRFIHQMDRLDINLDQVDKDDNEARLIMAAREVLPSFEPDQESLNLHLEGSRSTNTTRIEVLNDNGTVNPSDEARQLLQFLLQQLK